MSAGWPLSEVIRTLSRHRPTAEFDPERSSRRDRNEHLRLFKVTGQRVQIDPHEPPGSMPAALMTAAAAGEVRNLNKTLAASGSVAVVTIPAEITFMACSSAGSGPSNSAPGTNTISLIS